MISVLIPYDLKFYRFYDECKNLYCRCQDKIGDTNSFEFICCQTFFYMFVYEDKLIGAIYYFLDEDKRLFLNGFANRKMHYLNLECLKISTEWFNSDIFAQAQNRASALCLLRCGFERFDKNIFILKK